LFFGSQAICLGQQVIDLSREQEITSQAAGNEEFVMEDSISGNSTEFEAFNH